MAGRGGMRMRGAKYVAHRELRIEMVQIQTYRK
jgi:hypothetical protein